MPGVVTGIGEGVDSGLCRWLLDPVIMEWAVDCDIPLVGPSARGLDWLGV